MKLHHDGIRYISNISAALVAMVSHLIQHWLVQHWRPIQPFMRMNHASIQQRQFMKQRRSMQAIARRRTTHIISSITMIDWSAPGWQISIPSL